MKKSTWKIGLIILFILILSGIIWGGTILSYPPMPEAINALESDNQVTANPVFVQRWLNYYYVFEPAGKKPSKGLIIYPGALVDSRAYAPTARAIAAKGYLTVIVSVPFNLAIFGYSRVNDIVKQFPEIEKWALGGHSLGAAMACRYARNFSGKMSGLVLWAGYPTDSFRIDDKNIKVVSVYGTEDGRATLEEIEDSKTDLPGNAQFVEIKGGNHTQFGWYGDGKEIQKGDNPAEITREKQQAIIVNTTVDFLGQL